MMIRIVAIDVSSCVIRRDQLRQTTGNDGLRSPSGFSFARDASLNIRIASKLLACLGDGPTDCGIDAQGSIVEKNLGT